MRAGGTPRAKNRPLTFVNTSWDQYKDAAEAAAARGDFATAESLWTQLLAAADAAGHHDARFALGLDSLGKVYAAQKRFPQAEAAYAKGIQVKEALFGRTSIEVAKTCNFLAALCYEQNKFDKTEALGRRALTIYQALLGYDHPAVATMANNLARLQQKLGRPPETSPGYPQQAQPVQYAQQQQQVPAPVASAPAPQQVQPAQYAQQPHGQAIVAVAPAPPPPPGYAQQVAQPSPQYQQQPPTAQPAVYGGQPQANPQHSQPAPNYAQLPQQTSPYGQPQAQSQPLPTQQQLQAQQYQQGQSVSSQSAPSIQPTQAVYSAPPQHYQQPAPPTHQAPPAPQPVYSAPPPVKAAAPEMPAEPAAPKPPTPTQARVIEERKAKQAEQVCEVCGRFYSGPGCMQCTQSLTPIDFGFDSLNPKRKDQR